MSLTITATTTPGARIIPQPPATILALATAQGTSIPTGATVVAITIPIVRVDQTGLRYHTRNRRTEFLFDRGTLTLTVRQEIHISNALSPCARTAWLQHERKHVSDNEKATRKLDAKLRADSQFAAILVAPTLWRPVGTFGAVQRTIQQRVGTIFEDLTRHAATTLDTRREYARVERQIRIRCGGRVARILKIGMYGKGIDIVQLALNNSSPTALPRLQVDGIFGPKTKARVVEFQRQRGIDDNGVVGPDTRRELGIR